MKTNKTSGEQEASNHKRRKDMIIYLKDPKDGT
jgi:hypothetical protein